MSQNDKIIQYMQAQKSITPMDALKLMKCMRLASRINDLRALDWQISTVMESYVDEEGRTIKYARYVLDGIA